MAEQQVEIEQTSSESDCTTKAKISNAPQKKKAKFLQNFVQSGLHDLEFKSWLSKKPGNDGKLKPFCSWYDIEMTCSKIGSRRHSLSSRHCSNKKTCVTNLSIQAMWNNTPFAKNRAPNLRIYC